MPDIGIPEKIERVRASSAMYKVLAGGRGSWKSGTTGRIMLMDCQTKNMDVLCGREFQNSIEDSVHKLLKGLINDPDHGIYGFDVKDKKITCQTNDRVFSFKGWGRNPANIKSAEDFGRCWGEEAQTLSQDTLDLLLPTIRGDGSQIYFTMNPGSSEDPMSKRFLVPFMDELLKNGFYEDDMHCIAMVNWRDVPFQTDEMVKKRRWDYKHMTRAKYRWIWEGDFNDSVESPLIMSEWFDACVDAHKKLGFKPIGMKLASHDPSDIGPDSKGYAMRHGSVVLRIEEMTEGDINEGGDWATGLAIKDNVDSFSWDVGGMGTGLKRQISKTFEGKHTIVSMFDGSKGVDKPESVYEQCGDDGAPIQDEKKVKDAIKNRRAQYYFELRKRVYNTYRAVVHGEYKDPDSMISFDSSIKLIPKLRSELCRMPIKPNRNGLFELYTKLEMKTKFKFDSPNLADPVMMSMRTPQPKKIKVTRRPKPSPSFGNKRRR